MPDLRPAITTALAALAVNSLRSAALGLFQALGYHSDRILHLEGSRPQAFLDFGLFECLDRTEGGTDKKRYLDGFSRNTKKRPHVPDRLFFDSGETTDLSTAYGDKKRKAEKVTGLITILNRYKFTIVENTPIDQEIALDPELLGKVFENLLASYNEETKTTARKQTGSFYTPRPILDYMVDESLKAHLESALTPKKPENTKPEKTENPSTTDSSSSVLSVFSVAKNSFASVVRQKLDDLFTYTEEPHQFSEPEVATLIVAIDALKSSTPPAAPAPSPWASSTSSSIS